MLTDFEFEKICRLSKISIPEKNKEAFMKKLNTIFEWIDKLQEVDVSDVELDVEWSHIYNEGREDVACENSDCKSVLLNAKDVKYDMYSVPKVIE